MAKYESKNIKSNIEFKKNPEAGNDVTFKMNSLKIISENFPQEVNMLFVNEDDITWGFTYSIKIFEEDGPLRIIEIWLSFKLHYKNDPFMKSIVDLECLSEFEVTNKINQGAKEYTLNVIFDFTNWAMQGIYCSRLSGSSISMIIPPELRLSIPKTYFTNLINYDWN